MNPNNRSGSRGLKGVGCLCLLIAAVLLVFGPRNAAGHVLWWWYLIPAFGVTLWLAGGKGKVASDAPAQKGIKECLITEETVTKKEKPILIYEKQAESA